MSLDLTEIVSKNAPKRHSDTKRGKSPPVFGLVSASSAREQVLAFGCELFA